MDNIKNDVYYIDLIKKDIDKIGQYTKDVSYDEFIIIVRRIPHLL